MKWDETTRIKDILFGILLLEGEDAKERAKVIMNIEKLDPSRNRIVEGSIGSRNVVAIIGILDP